MSARSWLCPTEDDRQRFLDMQGRLGPARAVTIACCVPVLLALSDDHRIWLIASLAAAMIAIVLLGARKLATRRRPELWVFTTTVLNIQAMLAVATVIAGGPRTMMSCMLVVPLLILGARFSTRGLVIGAPLSAALVLAVTLGVDPRYVVAHPLSVVVPLALIVITTAYLGPLVNSDARHRSEAMIDALTGLLNRRTLENRLAELFAQARVGGEPVGAIAFDVDHFKDINDRHGHAGGDRVLVELTASIRRRLRSFELLYRVGGDEFVLLLPGAAPADAVAVGESIREAVAETRPLGLVITCSVGVASLPAPGTARELLAAADAALYRAKRDGRNRVEADRPLRAA